MLFNSIFTCWYGDNLHPLPYCITHWSSPLNISPGSFPWCLGGRVGSGAAVGGSFKHQALASFLPWKKQAHISTSASFRRTSCSYLIGTSTTATNATKRNDDSIRSAPQFTEEPGTGQWSTELQWTHKKYHFFSYLEITHQSKVSQLSPHEHSSSTDLWKIHFIL